MAQLNVTELDFDGIKQSLKTFLSAQDEFSDYNFEGSAMSVLLDVLAYNTHYNAVLAHMLANESFLDTAIKRSSVVSLAKAIGYTPRSRRAATAKITFKLTPDAGYTESSYTLSRNTPFSANKEGTTYNFYPATDVQEILQTINGVDVFLFENLDIKEGIRVSNSFLIDANTLSGPILIPNPNVDTTTLRVRVQTSVTDLEISSFSLYTNFVDVTATTKAYFLEESIDGLYQIKFGDDVIGKKLTAGNIVIVDYLTSKASDSNGAKLFKCYSTLTGGGEIITIPPDLVSEASGGQIKESIDSIRRNAPRYNATKERAVTSSDYQSLILSSNANIQSVAVWGGENNDPPIYGKVFISLNPVSGSIITQTDKDNIINNIIVPKATITILPEFIDPEYTYVSIKVRVLYDSKITTLTAGQISAATSAAISDYFTEELNILNKSFYFSRLHDIIKESDDAIISVNLRTRLQKRITPTSLSASSNLTTSFNIKIQPGEMHTTWFDVIISGATHKVKIIDVPASTVVYPEYSGTGTLYLQQRDGSRVQEIGSIDYDTGKITIPSLTVTGFYSTDTFIRMNLTTHEDVQDIATDILTRASEVNTSAVVALASRNTVLTLDDSVIDNTSGARKGLEITVQAKVEAN
jgi:hypothetical protein